jgi:hypothetical protein
MKKKAKAKAGKVKSGRKRSATKDLSARKASSVKGGLLPAVYETPIKLPDRYKVAGDGSVRPPIKIAGTGIGLE